MDILESALGSDIKAVMTASATDSNYYWTCEIHCGTEDTIKVIKVLSIDFVCDYETKFTDEVLLRCVVGGGQYAYHVYPYLSQLEITLYKVPVVEVGGGVDMDPSQSERYVATLLKPFNPAVEANAMNQPDEYSLDLTNLLEVDFQLVTKPVEQFRMRSYGGIFRNQTVEDVIKHVLTDQSKQVETDQNQVPVGVDMVSANNTAKRDHIVIPHGTRFVDVPGYINAKCGGVYNSGFAYYFHADHWYVFPPYNNANFDTNPRTATIVNVPSNRMPGIERTYRKVGNNLTILATGDTNLFNSSEKSILNEGNGVRFADANQFMENFVKTKDNKTVAGRGGNNSEFTTISRENGLNNVLTSENRITANPFTEYSKLAARDGILVALSWEHSNPQEIYPGMPVRILYLDTDEIKTVYGLIIKAQHYVNTVGQGFQTNRHFTTSNLLIFCRRALDVGSQTAN